MNTLVLVMLAECMVVVTNALNAQTEYNMDQYLDCNRPDLKTIPNDETITISAKSLPLSSFKTCRIDFRTTGSQYMVRINFITFFMSDCTVKLLVWIGGDRVPKEFDCQTSKPEILQTQEYSVTFRLDRDLGDTDYGFKISLQSYRESEESLREESHPAAVGLVIGLTLGVIALVVIAILTGVCFHKKIRKMKYRQGHRPGSHHDDTGDWNYKTTPFSDELPEKTALGNGDGSKLLKLDYNNRINEYRDNHSNVNFTRETRQPVVRNLSSSPNKNNQNRQNPREDVDGYIQPVERPKSLLDDLNTNKRFRESFHANEKESAERVRRYSESPPQTPAPIAPTSTSSPPQLPPVPTTPKSNRANKGVASIRRTPRPSSSSSEIEQLCMDPDDIHDTNIKIIKNNGAPTRQEVVPITLKDPQGKPQHSLRPDRGAKNTKDKNTKDKKKRLQSDNDVDIHDTNMEVMKNSDSSSDQEVVPQAKPQHVLRPDRGAKTQDKKKKLQSSTDVGQQPTVTKEEPVKNTNSKTADDGTKYKKSNLFGTKQSRTSLRARAGGKNKKAECDSIMSKDDDLESLPPLRRSGSKQSLYSSRTSLYGRRRRERRPSYSESVQSYSHDDIDAYRPPRHRRRDRYEYDDDYDEYYDRDEDYRPISRNSRQRISKSMGDIYGPDVKERGTQTLRETATQTGGEVSVHRSKVVKSKHKRGKSTSAMSTQTSSKTDLSTPKAKRKTKESSSAPSTPKAKRKEQEEKTDTSTRQRKKSQDELTTPSTPKSKKKTLNNESDKVTTPRSKKKSQSAEPHEQIKTQKEEVKDSLSEASTKKPKPKPRKSHGAKSVDGDQQSTDSLDTSTKSPSVIPQPEPSVVYLPYQSTTGQPMMQQPQVAYIPHSVPVMQGQYTGTLPSHAVPSAQQTLPQQPPPVYSVQPGGPPPTYPTKPKSNWEKLCDLTDNNVGDKPMGTAETGSLASSVFTSANPSLAGNRGYVPYPMAVNTQQPEYNTYPVVQPESINSRPIPNNPAVETIYPRKSSWEVLKDITDSQYKLTYGSQYDTESNV